MSSTEHKRVAPMKLFVKAARRPHAIKRLCAGRGAPFARSEVRNANAATTTSANRGKLCRRTGLTLTLAMTLGALGLSGPALAHPVAIVWSTFMRTGPGAGYDVVDELIHDTVVDLRTCGPRWCQIVSGPTVGYIDKDSLILPRLPGGATPVGGPQGCFVAGQYAWRKPAPTRFCQTWPQR